MREVSDRKGAASYLGTYLAKSRQTFPKGARVFAVSKGWRRGWVKRTPEPGRFLSGPPEGVRFGEWAELYAGADVRQKIRQRREAADRWLAELEAGRDRIAP